MQTRSNLVKTQYNREEHPCNYEVNDKPSLTIPDQTMSIRTIIERYTRGLPISASQNIPMFQDGEEFNPMPDSERLDLHDRMEFAQQARQELEEIKEKLNTKKYPKKTQGVEGTVVPPTLPEKGAEGTEAQKIDVENV